MKELILKERQEAITFDENYTKGDYCYGVETEFEKGWIQPVGFGSNQVQFLGFNEGVRSGNSWSSYKGEFSYSCKRWLSSGNKIYRFANEKELFTWLSE